MIEIFIYIAVGFTIGSISTYFYINVRTNKQSSQGDKSPNVNGDGNKIS